MLSRWVSLGLVAVTVAGGYAVSLLPAERPVVSSGLRALPADTEIAGVTDWRQVRDEVGADDMLEESYARDLSAASVLAGSAEAMAGPYGWSVHTVRWEALGQSSEGAVAVAQLADDVAVGTVRSSLDELGYRRPSQADGVWAGGEDLVASIDPTLTPLLGYVVVRDDGQVVMSDREGYAREAAAVLDGDARSFAQTGGVTALASDLRGALATSVYAPARGCAAMGFEDAGAEDQALAARRTKAVGGIRNHRGVGIALVPGEDSVDLLVAMHFAAPPSGEADRRAALATGEAPAQGGTFEERFSVEAADTRGSDVVLRMRPREPDAQLLSDLGRGPFLPASCG
ncbi:MAG: hypothetical protein ACRDO1_19370 [Nocardioidaceae bacterium]